MLLVALCLRCLFFLVLVVVIVFAGVLGAACDAGVFDVFCVPAIFPVAAKADVAASARIIVLIRKNLLIFILRLPGVCEIAVCLRQSAHPND